MRPATPTAINENMLNDSLRFMVWAQYTEPPARKDHPRRIPATLADARRGVPIWMFPAWFRLFRPPLRAGSVPSLDNRRATRVELARI